MWGALHGGALVVHKEWVRAVGPGRLPTIVSRLLTLYVVLLAWIFFRASSFPQAWTMAKAWLWLESPGERRIPFATPFGVEAPLLAGAIVVLPLLAVHVAAAHRVHVSLRRVLPAVVVTLLLGALAELALAFMPLAARPFIYFQF